MQIVSRLRRVWDWAKYMWHDTDGDPRTIYEVLRKKLVRIQNQIGYNRDITTLINLIDRYEMDYYLLEPFAHIHVTGEITTNNKIDFHYENDSLDAYFNKYHHKPQGLYSGDRFEEAAEIAVKNHERAHRLLAKILYEKAYSWGGNI